MLWKKKEKEVSESIYICEGINYLQVVEVNGENLDSVKEELFEYFKKANKVYSKSDIQLMTNKLEYDIWNSFIWKDISLKDQDRKVDIQLRYRWLGLNPELSVNDLLVNPTEVLTPHINLQDFYDRSQIENISQVVGFSVWDRSNWQHYIKTSVNYPVHNLSYEYYKRSNS